MIKKYNSKQLDEIVKILNNDGVVGVPTDTVYGLCARISSDCAYNKLLKVKNRPSNKLFSIMCCYEQIKSIAYVGNTEEKIIQRFMPGPITLILKIKDDVFKYKNSYKDTVAVRMATSKELEYILKQVGPVFMSSANQSGEDVCKSVDQIIEKCPDIDGVLIGDVLYNKASTIVDCTSSNIKILREGPISLSDILNSLK